MLTPRDLERLPEAMVELYAQVEQDILSDMARRIATYDYWIPAAEHQHRVLAEAGQVHGDVMEALAARTGKSRGELERLMTQAGQKALDFDVGVYRDHELTPPPLRASKELQAVLKAGMKQTGGLFRNLTRTTANTATKQFEDTLDRAWLQISSGAFDSGATIRSAVKELARQGVGAVRYPSGHVDSLEVAVRRAVVTGVNQAALKLQEALADQMGSDLVEVTAHAGARPEHAFWQGGVFSRSGRSRKHKGLREATGYGTGPGLGGWNCRHSFFPWFEGDPRAYTPEMLKQYEAKSYTYNGQSMTEYDAAQRQRYIERQVRRWKRENIAMKAAGLDASESAAKVRQWQETQRDFLGQTGLKRQVDREQVAGFGTAEARAVERTVRDRVAWEKTRDAIGKNAPKSLEDFIKIKYTDSEEWGRLMENKRLFDKIDSTATYPAEYKAKMKQTYQYFKDQGFVFREHALNRMLGQRSGKDKFSFAKEDLLSALRLAPNFRQADGKLIRFYNGMAVVSASDTGEIVSIVIRSKAKADWEAI